MKTINQLNPTLIEKRIIPTHAEIIYFEELSAIVYIQKSPQLIAKGFHGKRIKSDFHYRFDSVVSLETFINKWKKRRENEYEAEKEYSQKCDAYTHPFKVGDVLSTSWGYEQTNVEFFQVIQIPNKKSIKLCEISQEVIDLENGFVKPCLNAFINKPITRKVSIHDSVQIDRCRMAVKMKGESEYQTPSWMRY